TTTLIGELDRHRAAVAADHLAGRGDDGGAVGGRRRVGRVKVRLRILGEFLNLDAAGETLRRGVVQPFVQVGIFVAGEVVAGVVGRDDVVGFDGMVGDRPGWLVGEFDGAVPALNSAKWL